MNKAPNKRRSTRFNCAVRVESKEGSAFDQTATIDISKGGIGFLSHQRIPVNKKIAIEIDLDDQKDPVLVMGKVRWVRHLANSELFRIGLVFDNIIRGSVAHLNKYFVSRI